jgi:hypothetical protein
MLFRECLSVIKLGAYVRMEPLIAMKCIDGSSSAEQPEVLLFGPLIDLNI